MNKPPLDRLKAWSKAGHRTAMGETLVLLADEKPELCTITADFNSDGAFDSL